MSDETPKELARQAYPRLAFLDFVLNWSRPQLDTPKTRVLAGKTAKGLPRCKPEVAGSIPACSIRNPVLEHGFSRPAATSPRRLRGSGNQNGNVSSRHQNRSFFVGC
jgi:hypothetical protein